MKCINEIRRFDIKKKGKYACRSSDALAASMLKYT